MSRQTFDMGLPTARVSCRPPFFGLVVAVVLATGAEGSTIFLGPAPYQSAADSPFDLFGLSEQFFLEDFEDGELNVPGVSVLPFAPGSIIERSSALIHEPGSATDSVDADDGVIDGDGSSGHSLRSDNWIALGTFPARHRSSIELDFDSDEVGFAPNAVGFAWTDFIHNSNLSISITDTAGAHLDHLQPSRPIGRTVGSMLGDASRNGTTAEDRFFGVIHSSGIRSIRITAEYVGDPDTDAVLEIDHLQYGLASATYLPGDYNGDSQVDQTDLNLVLTWWGTDLDRPVSGWVNQQPSGAIDQEELQRVLLNWGRVAENPGPQNVLSALAVPEPPTAALAALLVLVVAARSQRSRRSNHASKLQLRAIEAIPPPRSVWVPGWQRPNSRK